MGFYNLKFLVVGGAIGVLVCIIAVIVIALATNWFEGRRGQRDHGEVDQDLQSEDG